MADRTTSVFVTGGSGYVGRRFLELGRNKPATQYALQHTGTLPAGDNIVAVPGSFARPAGWLDALTGVDAVVWFAASRVHFASDEALHAVNVAPVKAALEHLGVHNPSCRFIYISTISVLDRFDRGEGPITNDVPPRPATPYGRSKYEAERLVAASDLPYTIIRLPFMYGSGYGPNSHMLTWRRFARAGLRRYFRFDGQITLLHTEDLGRILWSYLTGEIDWPVRDTVLFSDRKRHEFEAFLAAVEQSALGRTLRPVQWRMPWRGLINTLGWAVPSVELRYWNRMFTTDHAYTVEPSMPAALDGYRFMPLDEGLAETYYGD